MGASSGTVSDAFRPVVQGLIGDAFSVRFEFWDGSELGPPGAPATVLVRSPRALRRLLWDRGELGLARAYVSGDIEINGDIYAALDVRASLPTENGDAKLHIGTGERLTILRAAARVGALGLRPEPPPEEVRLHGRRHTQARDRAAVTHHYDISNDFYRLVLGETITYSCAFFDRPDASLDDAQRAKYDLVCRKLGLAPGMRLLDVGCGWGGMVMHAAENYGVSAVGVTISPSQAGLASKRVAEAGLSDRVEIRIQDYRDITDGPYDAISSIGMFEHVGVARLRDYFGTLRGLLRPEGRLLNHAISRPGSSNLRAAAIGKDTFIARYVFPDGELMEVGDVVSAMQDCGFEARDVESLREHYELTLRAWGANLESSWDRAVELVGPGRARVWRLYMAASALQFESNRNSIHQVLGVRTGADGRSGMPRTRAELLGLAPLERAEGVTSR